VRQSNTVLSHATVCFWRRDEKQDNFQTDLTRWTKVVNVYGLTKRPSALEYKWVIWSTLLSPIFLHCVIPTRLFWKRFPQPFLQQPTFNTLWIVNTFFQHNSEISSSTPVQSVVGQTVTDWFLQLCSNRCWTFTSWWLQSCKLITT